MIKIYKQFASIEDISRNLLENKGRQESRQDGRQETTTPHYGLPEVRQQPIP